MSAPTPEEVDRMLRPLQLKDLRGTCRARGLNPAGGKEELTFNIKQHMFATGNFNLAGGADGPAVMAPQGYQQFTPSGNTGVNNNNYSRPGGQQNVGNFITDRPSSHVMAPPGGHSQIQLGGGYGGDYPTDPQGYGAQAMGTTSQAAYGASRDTMAHGSLSNNYSRPGGQQNVGNFITDRPSSRVLAPPGGASQIAFGDYNQPPPAPAGPPGGYQAPPPPYGVQPGYGSPGMPPANQHGGYGANPTAGATSNEVRGGALSNNYSRPNGQQNVGNFITDRPSSRVLAPPGGRSQISFG